MQERVWVDGWQMQCCGDPFSVGDTVSWTLSDQPDLEWLTDVVGPDLARTVTRAEEHHGGLPEDAPTTTGSVARIRAVACRYAPRPFEDQRTLYAVRGSGQVTAVPSADGRDRDTGDLRFCGYLVDLDTARS